MDLITLHPKLVHFPIALLYTGLFFEILFLFKRRDTFQIISTWLFNVGCFTAILAVASGLLAADTLGHDSLGHDKVHEHRNLMFITMGTWVFVFIALKFIERIWITGRRFLVVGYLIIAIPMTWGADMGGKLIFETGVGVKPMMERHSQDRLEHKQLEGKQESSHNHKHTH